MKVNCVLFACCDKRNERETKKRINLMSYYGRFSSAISYDQIFELFWSHAHIKF
jgi:hypothetical protein